MGLSPCLAAHLPPSLVLIEWTTSSVTLLYPSFGGPFLIDKTVGDYDCSTGLNFQHPTGLDIHSGSYYYPKIGSDHSLVTGLWLLQLFFFFLFFGERDGDPSQMKEAKAANRGCSSFFSNVIWPDIRANVSPWPYLRLWGYLLRLVISCYCTLGEGWVCRGLGLGEDQVPNGSGPSCIWRFLGGWAPCGPRLSLYRVPEGPGLSSKSGALKAAGPLTDRSFSYLDAASTQVEPFQAATTNASFFPHGLVLPTLVDLVETVKGVLHDPPVLQGDSMKEVEAYTELEKEVEAPTKPVKEMKAPTKPGVSRVEETLVDPGVTRTKGVEDTSIEGVSQETKGEMDASFIA
ncbi:hypothetical protein LWI28_002840 [Acer negundo]|uniref:Uncharacterized protein n=1 Tax=Acer negundo TaxID=4023 RepID=A0AAD5NZ68_ACENE|nr:hypothetical protein LWI28_002840 [Acer negundo]